MFVVDDLADAAREHDAARRVDLIVAAKVLDLCNPAANDAAHALTVLGSEVVVGATALVFLGTLLWHRRTARAVSFGLQ